MLNAIKKDMYIIEGEKHAIVRSSIDNYQGRSYNPLNYTENLSSASVDKRL